MPHASRSRSSSSTTSTSSRRTSTSHRPAASPPSSPTTCPPPPSTLTHPPPPPSAAAQKRFQAAADLHATYGHPSDATLKAAITSGSIKTDVTPKDIDDHRATNGPCLACMAGKLRDRPHPPTSYTRGTSPGSDLYIDLHDLQVPSPGGSTISVLCADGYSGRLDIQGAKTKTSRDILFAILTIVAISYNAYRHTVARVWTDSEAVLKSLRAALGIFGIVLKLFTPLEHNRFFERYNLTLSTRSRATRASLPYSIPPKYDIYLASDTATKHNALPNSRTGPNTCPYTLVTKQPPPPAHGAFGQVYLVASSDDQRATIAKKNGTEPKSEPPGVPAVNLGNNTLWPFAPQVLLRNGLVVTRELRSRALSVTPPNFPPNPNYCSPVSITPAPALPPSAAAPAPAPTATATAPPSQPNTLLQQSTLTHHLDILLPVPKGALPSLPPTDFTSAIQFASTNRFSDLATDDDTDDESTANTDPAHNTDQPNPPSQLLSHPTPHSIPPTLSPPSQLATLPQPPTQPPLIPHHPSPSPPPHPPSLPYHPPQHQPSRSHDPKYPSHPQVIAARPLPAQPSTSSRPSSSSRLPQ